MSNLRTIQWQGFTAQWGGKLDPPEIGTKIRVNFNNLGEATVTGFFIEEGYFGVKCKPANPPAWWLKQNPGRTEYMVFGTEIEQAAA